MRTRSSVGGIATPYGLDRPGFQSDRDKKFSLLQINLALFPDPLLFNGYRVSFPRVKPPGHEVHYSSPITAEVKN